MRATQRWYTPCVQVLDRWRSMPPEDRRYIGAAIMGVAAASIWAVAIRSALQAPPLGQLGDEACTESVYGDVLGAHGLNAEQIHRAWLYAPVITGAALHFGVGPDLMMAIAHTESGFNPTVGSGAGAQGLMQIMPSTGRLFRDRLIELGDWPFLELDLHNPEQSAWIAAKYMRDALRNRGSLDEALAAYNCGPKRCPRGSSFDSWPSETRGYVRGVQRRMKHYRQIWATCGSPLAM